MLRLWSSSHWTSGADSALPRGQGPAATGSEGRGQGNYSHSLQEELWPLGIQGSSNYGDKDISEINSPVRQKEHFLVLIFEPSLNYPGLWTTSNWTGASLQVLIKDSNEEAFYFFTWGSTVLLLQNKEKDIPYHFSQLSFKPVSRTSFFFVRVHNTSWLLSYNPHFWFLHSQDEEIMTLLWPSQILVAELLVSVHCPPPMVSTQAGLSFQRNGVQLSHWLIPWFHNTDD